MNKSLLSHIVRAVIDLVSPHRLSRVLLGTWLMLGIAVTAVHALPNVPAGIDHAPFDTLLREYVDDKGLIDYQGWKNSADAMSALNDYLAQFAPTPEEVATGDDKIASLINAYNAFTIQFILTNYPTESIRLLEAPFEGKRNMVGGKQISVDDIEHAMLRPIIGWKVHSVVVCAARSCPPMLNRAYFPDTWQDQMEERYRTWLAREDLNAYDTGRFRATVEISRIFRWYEDDYTGENSVENILRRFGPERYKDFLSRRFRISYQSYDWGLNDQGKRGESYRHNPLRGLF